MKLQPHLPPPPPAHLPPHPPLDHYGTAPHARRRFVRELFDSGAPHYDRIASAMSLGTGYLYRRGALRRHGLVSGMRVLDVATGTGLVARAAIELLGPQGEVVGLDPSRGMLDECRRVPRVSLVQGTGDSLPFADAAFDFLTMGYALRHVEDLETTFHEYRRVLRPGGRVLILEISRPERPVGRALAGFYFGKLVPLVARVTMGSDAAQQMMTYYWDTIRECVPPEAILGALRRAGFSASERVRSGGIFSEFTALA